jgi:hypothetical protein
VETIAKATGSHIAGDSFPDGIGKHFLRPAFSSPAQIISFILLIVFAILLPIFIAATGKITRRNSYEIMPEQHGAYSFVKTEIFDNGEDIDILFVGSSIQWNAIDTPQVQRALSDAAGRLARVVSFGFNFNGIDIPYVQLRDVIERKRVRMVVFSVPRLPFNDGPNATGYEFLRYGEYADTTGDLPFKYKTALFAANVLRSPHDLLTLLRGNKSKPSKYAADLGANQEVLGMGRKPEKFVGFLPPSPVVRTSRLLFSDATRNQFEFTNETLPPYQDHYMNELVELLHRNRIPLAMINVPQYNERLSPRVIERFDWAATFNSDIPLIGIAPTTLFAGLTPAEVELLHCDQYHLNKNGNEFFTRTVLPAILEVYEKHATKSY